MKAFELEPGQEFKIEGWRKYRTVSKVLELFNSDHIFPLGRKVAIIHDGCKQLVVLKDREILIK